MNIIATKRTAGLSLFLTVTVLLLASLALVYTSKAQTYHYDSMYHELVRHDTTGHGDTMYVKEIDSKGHTLIEWGPNYSSSVGNYLFLSVFVMALIVWFYFLLNYIAKKLFDDTRSRFWFTSGLTFISGMILLFIVYKTSIDRWQRDNLNFIAYIVMIIFSISTGSYLFIRSKSSPLRKAVGIVLIAAGIAGIALFLYAITHAVGM